MILMQYKVLFYLKQCSDGLSQNDASLLVTYRVAMGFNLLFNLLLVYMLPITFLHLTQDGIEQILVDYRYCVGGVYIGYAG